MENVVQKIHTGLWFSFEEQDFGVYDDDDFSNAHYGEEGETGANEWRRVRVADGWSNSCRPNEKTNGMKT